MRDVRQKALPAHDVALSPRERIWSTGGEAAQECQDDQNSSLGRRRPKMTRRLHRSYIVSKLLMRREVGHGPHAHRRTLACTRSRAAAGKAWKAPDFRQSAYRA